MAYYIKPTCCHAWLIPYQADVPIEMIQKKNKAFVCISLIGKSEQDQNILDGLNIAACLAIEVKLIARRRENESLIFMVGHNKVVATCTNQQDVKESLVKKKVYSVGASIQGQFQDALSMIFYETTQNYPFVKKIFETAKDQAITLQKEAQVNIDHGEDRSLIELTEPLENDAEVKLEIFNLLKNK